VILGIYAVFMILALILIALGFAYDGMILKMLGFAFIFLINVNILGFMAPVGIQYHSGDIINETGTGITEVTIQYDTYNPHTIAYFFAIMGFFGSMYIFYEDYKSRRTEQE